MSQFFADFVFLLELVIIAGGMVILHKARRESPAALLRWAGYLLVIGGVVTALCTGYFWFKYHAQGDFDTAQLTIKHEIPVDMMKSMHQSKMPGHDGNRGTTDTQVRGSDKGAANDEFDTHDRHH